MIKGNAVVIVGLLVCACVCSGLSYSSEAAQGSASSQQTETAGGVTSENVDRSGASDGAIAAFVTGYLLESTSTPDSDEDGVLDSEDNCTLVANPVQLDVDADGFGNICDPDFNNDCIVNFIDLSELTDNFLEVGKTEWDLNGDGVTNFIDIALFQESFLASPGPSGVSGLCDGG